MSTPFLVFAATYVSVFTLGLQSLNVNQGHYLAAAVTSFFIGTGHIYLYKYMPSAALAELIAYYAGGICGITSSIWFHKRAKAWLKAPVRQLRAWFAERRIARLEAKARGMGSRIRPPVPWPPPPRARDEHRNTDLCGYVQPERPWPREASKDKPGEALK